MRIFRRGMPACYTALKCWQLFAFLTMLICTVNVQSTFAQAERLLIISPFLKDSPNPVQRDPAWVSQAQEFADYKTRTGMPAKVLTLEEIFGTEEGRDPPERIKKAIYKEALDGTIRYVMIVGTTDILPVRYRFRGEVSAGTQAYQQNADGSWRELHSGYAYIPVDAYYANLWRSDDPDREFDTWDKDGDNRFAELYNDNFEEAQPSLHPIVAVARVPAENVDQFVSFMQKVMNFEQFDWGRGDAPRALFVADSEELRGSISRKNSLKSRLPRAYDVTFLERPTDGTWQVRNPDGSVQETPFPSLFITGFIDIRTPLLLNYAGHGSSTQWDDSNFTANSAARLTNSTRPTIVAAAACTSGAIADVSYHGQRTAPVSYTSSVSSLSNGFLTRGAGGAVAYVGALRSMNAAHMSELDNSFMAGIVNGAETVGDAWMQAIEAFIDAHNLDTAAPPAATSDPAHPDGQYWDWWRASAIQMVFQMQLSGDPSLRIMRREMVPDLAPMDLGTFVRRVHVDPEPGGVYDGVRFYSSKAGNDILAVNFRYNSGMGWSPWRRGTAFLIPRLQAPSGRKLVLEYYATNRNGRSEPVKRQVYTPRRSEDEGRPSLVKSGLNGRVIDVSGSGTTAMLRLVGPNAEYLVSTDATGEYHFGNIPTGTYELSIAGIPRDHRQVFPKTRTQTVAIGRRHLRRDYMVGRLDGTPPVVTQDLPWRVVETTGCVYGTVTDDWLGTGIKDLRLSINDQNGRWLDDSGKWQKKATWLKPQILASFRYHAKGKDKTGIEQRVPAQWLKQFRKKIKKERCEMNFECAPLVWGYCSRSAKEKLPANSEIRVRATDVAGNTALAQVVKVKMKADFTTKTSGEALRVQFHNLSTGYISHLTWDFGDGTRSAEFAPTHTYKKPGAYNVTLTVIGKHATNQASQEIRVMGK